MVYWVEGVLDRAANFSFCFTPWKVLIMPRWSGELRTRLESLREVLLIAQIRMSHILVLVHLLCNGLAGRLANVRYPIG